MHPNEALLRESYEALERGDWEGARTRSQAISCSPLLGGIR
jgi:hypothetical protein